MTSAAAAFFTAKQKSIALLCLAQVLAMAVWFSASAVVPQLEKAWLLSRGQSAWLTMSVQIGFVAGALVSAALNLADRLQVRHIIIGGAIGASIFNTFVLLGNSYQLALVARFGTGAMLAGVYPPGMKLVATWTRADRGLGIGLLVGSITLGSALPHALNLLPTAGVVGMPPWEHVLIVTSLMSLGAAAIVIWGVREGPYLAGPAPFNWRYIGTVLANKSTRLANFGYLGHMWELYAVWVWIPILLLEVYREAGLPVGLARLTGFGVIAIGAIGCVVAGGLADRFGRTLTTILSLTISGLCCLVAGLVTSSPVIFSTLCLVWGFAVVADSAQFSTAVTELADTRYVGTALTLQTSMGFLLTLASIRVVPMAVEQFNWGLVFPILALGPAFGIWSMAALRKLPAARRMSSGAR